MIGGWLAKSTNLDLRVEESQSLDLCFGPLIWEWVWDLFNYKREAPPLILGSFFGVWLCCQKYSLLPLFSILLSQVFFGYCNVVALVRLNTSNLWRNSWRLSSTFHASFGEVTCMCIYLICICISLDSSPQSILWRDL